MNLFNQLRLLCLLSMGIIILTASIYELSEVNKFGASFAVAALLFAVSRINRAEKRDGAARAWEEIKEILDNAEENHKRPPE